MLLPIVNRFVAAYPGISVEIDLDSALIDVVSEGFDAGLRFGESIAEDMIAVPIGPRQRSAVVAAPALLEHHAKPKTPHDLLQVPCIRYRFPQRHLLPMGVRARRHRDRDCRRRPLSLTEQHLMVDAALPAPGIAYVFEGMVRGAHRQRASSGCWRIGVLFTRVFSSITRAAARCLEHSRAFIDFARG